MRSRNIKPGFFKNEVLAEMPAISRLLFIGLWTLADREGRLEDRPIRIKGELFPYESFDVGSILGDLQAAGFLIRYEVAGEAFIQIQNFVKHQDPHYKEKASAIPPPPGAENLVKATGLSRARRAAILERDNYTCQICGSTENLCVDHILPVSRGGDSAEENLQCLCMSCNTKKSNKVDGEARGQKRSKYNESSVISRPDVGPTSGRSERSGPSDSLIPDSLIPDSKKAPRKRVAKANGESLESILGDRFDSYWSLVKVFGSQKNPAPKTTAKLYAGIKFDLGEVHRKAENLAASMSDPKFMPQLAKWLEGQGWLNPDPDPQSRGRTAHVDSKFARDLPTFDFGFMGETQ